MSVKIRLQRRGRRKRPFYHIVIADSRAPRDGRFIEKIGTYNPMTKPATIDLDRDRAFEWLMKGAQPTDTARAILRFKGVMYRKHLQRGVSKGALTQEQADGRYQEWIAEKDAKVAERFAATAAEIRKFHAGINGAVPEIKAPTPEPVAAAEAAPANEAPKTLAEELEAKAAAEAAEATTTTEVATPVAAAAPATEEAAPAVEEAPATEEAAPAAEEAAPAADEAYPFVDEVVLLDGVGDATAEKLKAEGVDKLSQLLDMSDEDLKALGEKVGADPVKGEWKTQAQEMKDGKGPRAKVDQEAVRKMAKA